MKRHQAIESTSKNNKKTNNKTISNSGELKYTSITTIGSLSSSAASPKSATTATSSSTPSTTSPLLRGDRSSKKTKKNDSSSSNNTNSTDSHRSPLTIMENNNSYSNKNNNSGDGILVSPKKKSASSAAAVSAKRSLSSQITIPQQQGATKAQYKNFKMTSSNNNNNVNGSHHHPQSASAARLLGNANGGYGTRNSRKFNSHLRAILIENGRKATVGTLSWIGYGCVTFWLGVVMLLGGCTLSLILSVRHEALEDYTPVECGPEVVTQTLSTIGFGSCNKHDEPQTFWKTVGDILQYESTLAEHHQKPRSPNNKKKSNENSAVGDEAVAEITCHRDRVPSVRANLSRVADAFIWLGDAVYLDGNAGRGRNVTMATEIAYSAMDVRGIKGFEDVTNLPYRAFKERMAGGSAVDSSSSSSLSSLDLVGEASRRPSSSSSSDPILIPSRIIGTWDDHDMGINDGGKNFPYQKHTMKRFLDFLSVDEEDGLRTRNGIYSFHAIKASSDPIVVAAAAAAGAAVDGDDIHTGQGGVGGSSSSSSSSSADSEPYRLSDYYENAFCIILLDVRTHRDDILFSREGDMLGEAQWQWFEEILKKNVSDITKYSNNNNENNKRKCAATLIGSGIQFLSSEKPTEQWWNFKNNRIRLWKLLKQYEIGRAALLSGDIHLMELIRAEPSFTGLGYPMIDFTASGFTHHSGRFFESFTGFKSLLAKVFPMAVTYTPRGLTPVGNTDAIVEEEDSAEEENKKKAPHPPYSSSSSSHPSPSGRHWQSAFELLMDWIYETIFPHFGWRLAHYLGRNVGAISLQVSIPVVRNSKNNQNNNKADTVATRLAAPELSLRFAGYSLSLEERKIFMPWRYESGIDEPALHSNYNNAHKHGKVDGKKKEEGNGEEASPTKNGVSLQAHAVTRHYAGIPHSEGSSGDEKEAPATPPPPQWFQVIEFVQPLKDMLVRKDDGSDDASAVPIDGSNHHWMKTLIYGSQGFIDAIITPSSKSRNYGVFMGLILYHVPMGVVALWCAQKLVALCKGGAGMGLGGKDKKRRGMVSGGGGGGSRGSKVKQ